MITRITLKNFMRFKDASAPLQPLTVFVGPNGSGKSSVLRAIDCLTGPQESVSDLVASDAVTTFQFETGREFQQSFSREKAEELILSEALGEVANVQAMRSPEQQGNSDSKAPAELRAAFATNEYPGRLRIVLVSLEPTRLKSWHGPGGRLHTTGEGLSSWLDWLRDEQPDAFEEAVSDLMAIEPALERVLFDRDGNGYLRRVALQLEGGIRVGADLLSDGTILALALFAIARSMGPDSILLLEEPDRGLHPHLIDVLFQLLMELAYPEKCGIDRPPVQVLCTTHNPTFLNKFHDYPECVVVVEKGPESSTLRALAEDQALMDLVSGPAGRPGDLWVAGLIGGNPESLLTSRV